MYAGGWDAFFLVFESLKSQKNEKNMQKIENVENLLDPACSSSQSQPTHLARDGFQPYLEGRGCLKGWGGSGRAWEGLGVPGRPGNV